MSDIGTLEQRLRQIDTQAVELARSENVSWVRTRLGIIGEARVPRHIESERLAEWASRLIEEAHSLLDSLPVATFGHADLWNLLLFVAVSPGGLISDDQRLDLEELCRDLGGSRKVVLWPGDTLEAYLRPLTSVVGPALGSDDPFRDVIQRHAKSDVERRALELLYKRRLEEGDIDELVRALGRGQEV